MRADAGDIVAQRAAAIAAEGTAATLGDRLVTAGAELLDEALPAIAGGWASRAPQDESRASYFGGRGPADNPAGLAPGTVLAIAATLAVKDWLGFACSSDCRGRAPFIPLVADRELTLQLPVTLPTCDEIIGADGVGGGNYNEHILSLLRPGG